MASTVVFAVVWLAASAELVRRHDRARGKPGQRLRWMALGWLGGLVVAAVILALEAVTGWRPGGWVVLGASLTVPAAALACSGLGAARDRVDALAVPVAEVSALLLLVVSLYLLVVFGLGRSPSDREHTVLGLSLLAALLAAALFAPARNVVTRAVTRALYGGRRTPQEALDAVGLQLSRAVSLDDLLLQVTETLRRSLVLDAAELWLLDGDELRRTAADPQRGPATVALGEAAQPLLLREGVVGAAWLEVWSPALFEAIGCELVRVAPVIHGGALLGVLAGGRRAGAEPFAPEHDRVLDDLARRVGMALHNVTLDAELRSSLEELRRRSEALRASRARIVSAADEERRRVERDLHDGAQQGLVVLSVELRVAAERARENPELAAALERLSEEVEETLGQLRDLARGIYPPLLLSDGLSAALEDAAARAALPTTAEVGAVGRYRPEVETAVYFCCLEALQNAAKHAGPAARATVQLDQEAGDLVFAVADDGVGCDPERLRRGQGLVNMADRLGAVGGTITVESAPGQGTAIIGSIALADT